jgi:hypothetical protein
MLVRATVRYEVPVGGGVEVWTAGFGGGGDSLVEAQAVAKRVVGRVVGAARGVVSSEVFMVISDT